MVTPDFLEKFKKLHIKKFNIHLSDEEATKQATDFLNLMKVLLKKPRGSK